MNEKLFYMLIDESKRSFKRGSIVTATVVKIFEDGPSKVLCKLDNGLKAFIMKRDIVEDH